MAVDIGGAGVRLGVPGGVFSEVGIPVIGVSVRSVLAGAAVRRWASGRVRAEAGGVGLARVG